MLATGVGTRWGRSGDISSSTPLSPVLLLWGREEGQRGKGCPQREKKPPLPQVWMCGEQESVSSFLKMTATFILRDMLEKKKA